MNEQQLKDLLFNINLIFQHQMLCFTAGYILFANSLTHQS